MNPYDFKHSLCFSMNSTQPSSPLRKTHSSRNFRVSGHAQQGFKTESLEDFTAPAFAVFLQELEDGSIGN